MARGTSASGLLNGVVLQPLAFAGTFSTEIRVAIQAVVVTAVSLALAVAYRMTRRRSGSRPTTGAWLFWGLKLGSGLLGVSLAFMSPHALLGVGPALLWLVLIRPLGDAWRYEELMPRVVLVSLASLQTLQAYPVAESQVAWATFLFIPALLLSAADAIREFMAVHPKRALSSRVRVTAFLEAAALVGLLVAYTVHTGVVAAYHHYESLSPLPFVGATRIRLPQKEAERYRWLVGWVENHCGTLVTLPGLNSLYFWTTLQPPTGFNTTAWPILLDTTSQQRIVDAVRSREGGCVVEYPAGIRTGGRDAFVSSQPLWRFVRQEFQVVDEREGYRVMSRRPVGPGGS
jgi:hypothetical protein